MQLSAEALRALFWSKNFWSLIFQWLSLIPDPATALFDYSTVVESLDLSACTLLVYGMASECKNSHK